MKPVIQEDKTGCGLASVAALASVSYLHVKTVAKQVRHQCAKPSTLVRYDVCSKTSCKLWPLNVAEDYDVQILGDLTPGRIIGHQMAPKKESILLALGSLLARTERTCRT